MSKLLGGISGGGGSGKVSGGDGLDQVSGGGKGGQASGMSKKLASGMQGIQDGNANKPKLGKKGGAEEAGGEDGGKKGADEKKAKAQEAEQFMKQMLEKEEQASQAIISNMK